MTETVPPSTEPCCDGLFLDFNIELLRALSDPTRLMIVAELFQRQHPASVSNLTRCCGIDFSGVSRHLKVLKAAGVVEAKKSGRETHYQLRDEAVAAQFSKMAAAFQR